MNWILQHWQSIAVAGIVTVTLLVFLGRILQGSGSSGCGRNKCGCSAKPAVPRKR